MNISARQLDFRELNRRIKSADEDVSITDCCGQRFIGSGLKKKIITVRGTPGNALGSYLDGGEIHVHGNAQDAVGDTMNSGKIIIHGNAGDALGYAMRGGQIYVRGDAGYRTGIHMKQYKDKRPVIVVGGCVGSFLGEYLAGGIIVVLGLDTTDVPVGNFAGTGMHGGMIFVRTDRDLCRLPQQVAAAVATEKELGEIAPCLSEFAGAFGFKPEQLLHDRFWVLRPNASNPYQRLYVTN